MVTGRRRTAAGDLAHESGIGPAAPFQQAALECSMTPACQVVGLRGDLDAIEVK